MTTVADVSRRIEVRINEVAKSFADGSWMDNDRSAEWHGMQAQRQMAHIEGLRAALKIIEELQQAN